MMERTPEGRPESRVGTHHATVYAAGASEDLLTGGRLLRRAFAEAPYRTAERDAAVIAADDAEPPILQIHRGVAYRSVSLPDGRRAIVDIILPTDVVGVDNAVLGRSNHDVVAASPLGYRQLSGAALRELMANPHVAMRALALMGEQRSRIDRHLTAITRFDARSRIASFILGIYERLRRAELISRPTFNLQLTQDQMADHLGMTMVHISRTLRRLREERLVLVDRQVVIVLDVDGLRDIASGLPPVAELEKAAPAAQPVSLLHPAALSPDAR
ncbi:MAG TPA: Crp/Fnr family transcriptional regulator [Stellaceae bacterium]|nr:Crp/Fnr family transcriptional regulator [Stellaceae bacterium]